MLYRADLNKTVVRDNFRELVELCEPLGAIHGSQWITSVMFLFENMFASFSIQNDCDR